jgi:predicted DNA-binding transcriptional regulator
MRLPEGREGMKSVALQIGAEMKTNKHQTLLLVRKQGGVRPRDVVDHFGYSSGTARSYLSYLGRQGLLERRGAGYALTEKGQDRLQYFEVAGCADPACPLCQGKAGKLTCPSCGYQMPWRKARILKERDFFFVVRHAGVYCSSCWKPIFSETQGRLLGIREEM